jgi:hypothetical protein
MIRQSHSMKALTLNSQNTELEVPVSTAADLQSINHHLMKSTGTSSAFAVQRGIESKQLSIK